MRHHLLAYGAAALDATAGDVQLVAVADQLFNRANNNFQIPSPHRMLWARAGGATLTRSRFNTGSLRAKGFPQIYPIDTAVLPVSPQYVMDLRKYPIYLRQEEDVRVDVTNTAANTAAVLAAITPDVDNYNLNKRDLRWLRFTLTVTAVALGWSSLGSVVFQDTLEGGIYEVYGMAIQGAAVIAARLVFQNDPYRPGCLGQAALGDKNHELFNGGLGKWGEFNTYSVPQIETFETGAGASTPVGWLLCGK